MANEPASRSPHTPPAPGSVALLGAGPGDPELITARAIRRLREADVVLYDALVHPDLLAHAKPGAELVFVGKRAGRASERQTSINEQLLEAAKRGKKVARLKGGDPYLFGRGSEEAEELAAHGIPFEVVPGVASPMAASAYTGISLTHRNLASSVAYVTATESVEKDESAHDWDKLATATQTLVFFMGLRKLDSLMERLVAHGRSASTPAAVVSHASLPSQRTVVGSVGDIAQRVKDAGLEMPALTIVGPVVALHEPLRWFEKLPLFGKRVLVTRPEGQGDEMAQLLRDAGAEPLELPAVQIAAAEDTAPLDAAVRNLAPYGWLLFTSSNGVRFFFAALAQAGLDARALGRAKVAAVGPATRAALAEHGIRADVMPEEHRGEGLAEAILALGPLAGARVLLPRAAVAREVLPEKLREAGAQVDIVTAYRSLPTPPERFAGLREELAQGRVQVVTFTSSSTVDRLMEGLGPDARTLLERTCVAAISPLTAATAQKHGLTARVVAREYTAEGLVSALVAHRCELHDGP